MSELMDKHSPEATALHKAALACGLRDAVAFNDLADSIGAATQFGLSLDAELHRLWEHSLRSWQVLLDTYCARCFARWHQSCGQSRNYNAMWELWCDSFEPLWLVGCRLAQAMRIAKTQAALDWMVSTVSADTRGTRTEQAETESWARDFTRSLPNAMDLLKENRRETQRQAIT